MPRGNRLPSAPLPCPCWKSCGWWSPANTTSRPRAMRYGAAAGSSPTWAPMISRLWKSGVAAGGGRFRGASHGLLRGQARGIVFAGFGHGQRSSPGGRPGPGRRTGPRRTADSENRPACFRPCSGWKWCRIWPAPGHGPKRCRGLGGKDAGSGMFRLTAGKPIMTAPLFDHDCR